MRPFFQRVLTRFRSSTVSKKWNDTIKSIVFTSKNSRNKNKFFHTLFSRRFITPSRVQIYHEIFCGEGHVWKLRCVTCASECDNLKWSNYHQVHFKYFEGLICFLRDEAFALVGGRWITIRFKGWQIREGQFAKVNLGRGWKGGGEFLLCFQFFPGLPYDCCCCCCFFF